MTQTPAASNINIVEKISVIQISATLNSQAKRA